MSEAVGLAAEHLIDVKSDNSSADLARKRKRWGSQTDVSSSSGTGSPINVPFCIGYIGHDCWVESAEECTSDCSRKSSISKFPGYHSATTAIVSDSEDEVNFINDVTDLDTFSVEYEPPETGSEDEKDYDDDQDDEPLIVIPSSSEDEDPGAEGGDEGDSDDDDESSWECSECWTKNYPMTTKCLMCWKERIATQTSKTLKCIPDNVASDSQLDTLLSRSSSSSSTSTQASSDSGICVSSCEAEIVETTSYSSCNQKTSSKEMSSLTNKDSVNLCVICSTEPRNASIIHGRSGHQVCCITCAEKLKAERKRCPVCRRKIHLVIKNFL